MKAGGWTASLIKSPRVSFEAKLQDARARRAALQAAKQASGEKQTVRRIVKAGSSKLSGPVLVNALTENSPKEFSETNWKTRPATGRLYKSGSLNVFFASAVIGFFFVSALLASTFLPSPVQNGLLARISLNERIKVPALDRIPDNFETAGFDARQVRMPKTFTDKSIAHTNPERLGFEDQELQLLSIASQLYLERPNTTFAVQDLPGPDTASKTQISAMHHAPSDILAAEPVSAPIATPSVAAHEFVQLSRLFPAPRLPTPLVSQSRGEAPSEKNLQTVAVSVFAPSSLSAETIGQRLAGLRTMSARISEPQAVNFTINATQVRYYHRKDEASAGHLAAALDAQVRDFTTYNPAPPQGVVELWLSGKSTTRATTTRKQPQNNISARFKADVTDLFNAILRPLNGSASRGRVQSRAVR